MKDFGPILLVAILRATVQYVHQTPSIDPDHPGFVEFERVLNEQIARFQKNSPSTQHGIH
jgi:hypothetical protein